jgi:hypothetical protein
MPPFFFLVCDNNPLLIPYACIDLRTPEFLTLSLSRLSGVAYIYIYV